MEFAAKGADKLDQPPLDVEVDVFKLRAEGELARFELPTDGLEAADDGLRFVNGEDAGAPEGTRPRDRAGDIVKRQPLVKRQGGEEVGWACI